MASNQEVLTEIRAIRNDIGGIKVSFATHCEQSATRDNAIKKMMDDLYGNGKPSVIIWAREQMKKYENLVDDRRKAYWSWKTAIIIFFCTITISTFVGIVVDKIVK